MQIIQFPRGNMIQITQMKNSTALKDLGYDEGINHLSKGRIRLYTSLE